MTRLLADLRFALRNLRRSPLFAFVAVASLALGIGANTAIFTLIDQLLLRLLPVKNPEQLVMIWPSGPHLGNNQGSRASSYPMYQDFQQKGQAFSYVFCRYLTALSVSFGGQTERVTGELVSGNYFQALGVAPAVGRLFTPEEDDRTYKGHPVAVLSYQYWINRFNGDRNIVGRKLIVNNYPFTVVGVSAPGFVGLDPSRSPQVRVPILMKPLMTPNSDGLADRRSQWINMFARMKPGFTVDSAKASLQPLFVQILREELQQPRLSTISQYFRDRFLKRQVQMETAATGYSQMRRNFSTALIVLMCMVGLVLLIACFNVANLLIARAAARQKEVAVRLAVGASRGQVLRQLLVESVLLSLAGGVAGLLLSVAMIRGLLSFLPADSSANMLRAEPDARILAFNFVLAALVGLLFGLAPAWQSLRLDLWTTLKDAGSAVTGVSSSVVLRKILVVAQVAFSFLLLAGAGLFTRTLANLKQTNAGFRQIDNLVTFQVDPSLNGYSNERMKSFHRELLDAIRAQPGVRSAAIARVPVLHGWEWDSSMSVQGKPRSDGEDKQAFMNFVSPGYFETMGVPMLQGRDFTTRDFGDVSTVAIVNRKFATHYFGNESPIGRRIGFGGDPARVKFDIEIVGVTEDSLYEGPREGVRRQVFIAMLQVRAPGAAAYYVRTNLESKAMFTALRRKVAEIDPSMPVYEMKTLESQLDETLSTERLIAALSTAFGVLATLLAAIGLYGVMAFLVARRTREIGLRMALGAGRGDVLWMVMREIAVLVVCGLLVGAPATYYLSRYVTSQLYGVDPLNLLTAAIPLAILLLASTLAGWMPARRASSIDPMQALRYE
jgi:predicted permease